MTSIPVGPATSILQNIVYALPGKATFLTSNDVVETSLDQLTWTAQAESVTGMIIGSKFVRCTTTDSIIVCSNIVIESFSPTNPFDQDLNTFDSPFFSGLTLLGPVSINGLIYPSSDGSPDDVLTTDGNGNLSFQPVPSSNPFDQDLNTTDSPTFNALAVTSLSLPTNETPAATIELNFLDTALTALSGSLTISAFNNIQIVVDSGGAFPLFTFNLDGSFTVPDIVTATDFIATTNPGIDTTITTGGLVGKTITVVNGRITAFA